MSAPVLPDQDRTVEVNPGQEISTDDQGPDEVAHYVDQRFDQDIATAMIMGTELVALCGHRWVATRDPQKFPVCKACVQVLDHIRNH